MFDLHQYDVSHLCQRRETHSWTGCCNSESYATTTLIHAYPHPYYLFNGILVNISWLVKMAKSLFVILLPRMLRWLVPGRLGPAWMWKVLLLFVALAFAGQLLGVIFNKRYLSLFFFKHQLMTAFSLTCWFYWQNEQSKLPGKLFRPFMFCHAEIRRWLWHTNNTDVTLCYCLVWTIPLCAVLFDLYTHTHRFCFEVSNA